MNRASIKFCFKAGLSATETLVLVQKGYMNEAVNQSNFFRWYSRFRDGRLVEDGKKGGHPESTLRYTLLLSKMTIESHQEW